MVRLADFEVELAAAVSDATPVTFEPGHHRSSQLGCVAMVTGMGGGAHSIVEDALGRRPRQIEDTDSLASSRSDRPRIEASPGFDQLSPGARESPDTRSGVKRRSSSACTPTSWAHRTASKFPQTPWLAFASNATCCSGPTKRSSTGAWRSGARAKFCSHQDLFQPDRQIAHTHPGGVINGVGNRSGDVDDRGCQFPKSLYLDDDEGVRNAARRLLDAHGFLTTGYASVTDF